MEIFKRVGIASLWMGLLIGQAYADIPDPAPPRPRPPWGLEIIYAISIQDNPDYTHIIGLDWEESPDSTVVGYKVYQRRWPKEIGESVDTSAIAYTTESRKDSIYIDLNTYYQYDWWVTAIDCYGQESDPSNVVSYPSQEGAPRGIAQTRTMNSKAVLRVFPNIVRSIACISYQVSQNSSVSLWVYDAQGRLVERLIDKRVNPGIYQAEWTLKNIENGVYFVSLKAGSLTRTVKVIVAR